MIIPNEGTYEGMVTSREGAKLRTVLRWESRFEGTIDGRGVVSADFFRNDSFFCSLRAWLVREKDAWKIGKPSLIFTGEETPSYSGRLRVDFQGAQNLKLTCRFRNQDLEQFQGTLTFQSPYYRHIKICIGKTKEIPLPETLAHTVHPEVLAGNPPRDKDLNLSIDSIFKKVGILAEVDWIEDDLLQQYKVHGASGDLDLFWDEKELHELMEFSFPDKKVDDEWRLNLMILPGSFGEYRDEGLPPIEDDFPSLVGIMFDRHKGQQPLGESGEGFENEFPRQGAAIFWDALTKKAKGRNGWYLQREYYFWIIHELGHILNLKHPQRCESHSFMNYPANHWQGISDFWERFNYSFDATEQFHLRHGFYNEICPGAGNDFQVTTSDSFFLPHNLACKHSDFHFELKPSKSVFHFMEPVTLELSVSNEGSVRRPLPYLSPSFGELKILIKKPNGQIQEYEPPLQKCPVNREYLDPGATKTQLTSIMISREGFWLDAPGRYQAMISTKAHAGESFIGSARTNFLIQAPTVDNEVPLRDLYNEKIASFIYFAGGEHLGKAKNTLMDLVYRFPGHPLAPQANLVLGLHELRGQKSRNSEYRKEANPEMGIHFLCRALVTRKLPPLVCERLKKTLKYYRELFPQYFPDHFSDALLDTPLGRFERVHDFLGKYNMILETTDDQTKETIADIKARFHIFRAPEAHNHEVQYDLVNETVPVLDQTGRGRYHLPKGEQDGYLYLEACNEKHGVNYQLRVTLGRSETGHKILLLEGKNQPAAGGEGGSGTTSGTSEDAPPPKGS